MLGYGIKARSVAREPTGMGEGMGDVNNVHVIWAGIVESHLLTANCPNPARPLPITRVSVTVYDSGDSWWKAGHGVFSLVSVEDNEDVFLVYQQVCLAVDLDLLVSQLRDEDSPVLEIGLSNYVGYVRTDFDYLALWKLASHAIGHDDSTI
jgi:hypothetical protein